MFLVNIIEPLDSDVPDQNQPLRDIVDLRPWASAVEEQGHLGSCTGHLSNIITHINSNRITSLVDSYICSSFS
jgi:hypothetical protein